MKWLLGICGTAATVSSPSHICYLREKGISVRVVTSETALRFVSIDALESFSGSKVFTNLFDRGDGISIPHIELVNKAEIFVIMPASAHMLAKIAHGFGDDLISASVLNAEIPVLIVPAINATILNKSSTLRNIQQIKDDGLYFMDMVNEDAIRLSTGKKEIGTMPALNDVIAKAKEIVGNHDRK